MTLNDPFLAVTVCATESLFLTCTRLLAVAVTALKCIPLITIVGALLAAPAPVVADRPADGDTGLATELAVTPAVTAAPVGPAQTVARHIPRPTTRLPMAIISQG